MTQINQIKLLTSIKTWGAKLTIALSAFGIGSTALASVDVGMAAPAFKVMGTDGKEHTLESFKGKTVVLEWFNHECPFVRKHYDTNNMQKLQKTYGDKGVVWLAVNSSAPDSEGHLDAKGFGEQLKKEKSAVKAGLLDPTGVMGKAFGAKTTPHMYVIDPKGVLVYMGAIDSIRSTSKDDVPKATNYVAKALDEVLAGKPVSEPKTRAYGCGVKYAD